jgi:D-erythronate 2-dehydrogenase
MRILIIGAAGMVGRKLAQRLVRDGMLGPQIISEMVCVDVMPAPELGAGVEMVVADITQPEVAVDLIARRPEVIIDLAGVVSGEAEDNFDKGYRVNLDATRHLLEAVRLAGTSYTPRLVFSSSIAVFGPPMPDVITDDQATTPATSYGTQKAITELLLADYTRREFLDGIAIRLPTICVRPGAPNLAASGFFSNIIREPLHGRPAVRGGGFPAARCDDGHDRAGSALLADDAGPLGHGGRGDRGAAPRGRRRCGRPHPRRARRGHRADRRRVAPRL